MHRLCIAYENASMQQVIAEFDGRYKFLELPEPDETAMPGVRWGRFEQALTPAFWVSQSWMVSRPASFQLSNSLVEEVAVCLLGGHGAPAEVGLAAFDRVRSELGASRSSVIAERRILALLTEPLDVGGRLVRYRFARQRARYLAGSLEGLRNIPEDTLDDVGFRDALCELPGIGPKTASWIVRNRRGSDAVAILDVHIVRACQAMRLFPSRSDPARTYRQLEALFLEFCQRTGARASVLDGVMWSTMRRLSKRLLTVLIDELSRTADPCAPLFGDDGTCRALVADVAMGRRETVAAE
jgi:thermostable 8-oxoguanine DNA glycosylase